MRNFMRLDTPMLFFFACVIATQVSCSSDTTTNPGPPVAAITVALDASLLTVGHTAQASAAVKDSAGNAIDAQTVSWASQDTGVAKVSAEGAVTAVAAGSTVIQGKISGKIGGAPLTVVGPPNLAFHDFNDGTIGPFSYPYSPSTDLDFPNDPTGSGRGKVARLYYNPQATNTSSDKAFAPTTAAIGAPIRYGRTIWMRGDFYIPSANSSGNNQSSRNRKLIDYQGTGKPRLTLHRTGLANGTLELKMSIVDWMNGSEQEVMDPDTGIEILDDTWYTIEVKMVTNSADNVRDGVVEIYMNSSATPTYSRTTGIGWITEAYPGGSSFSFLGIGSQMSVDHYPTNPLFSEYRYWDNVAFSTTRIGR